VATALGQTPAVVILEPDALSDACISSTWYSLLQDAVQSLDGDQAASVYVDAGNPGWQSAATEAGRLQQVLGGMRGGFSVNVSNFYSTSADIAYGTAISQLTGGRHFVIDTSRNGGSVTPGQWCNPSGAELGATPTTATGNPLLDAELWIKAPGDSDGTCNGGPSAGQFWLAYALSLVP
jgi:endoglucanase